MIIAKYSNSVNVADRQIVELVVPEPTESPAMALYPPIEGVVADGRTIEIDICQQPGDPRYRNTWQVVRRMRDGMLDRTYVEAYATAGEAACKAVRIARCHGVGVSQDVEAVILREQRIGDELAFWDQGITRCDNEAQMLGYVQCMRTADDIIAEKDEKPGLDASEEMPWEWEDERESYMVEVMPGQYAYQRNSY